MTRPSLAEISTEIAALEEVIALRGRLVNRGQHRPDFDRQSWCRDAAALRRLVTRLKAEREALCRPVETCR